MSESSDSDSEKLKIDLENISTPKRKLKSRRKTEESQFDGSSLDKTIEETIKKCEHFTPEAAKKMLLKLVKNEHIIALSLLQAEEQEKRERLVNSTDSEDDKKSENDAPTTPKLTRLKAKQLNKHLPHPGSLKSPEPCEEVVALIQEELKSDDEDDEYHPGDEEIHSDEDFGNNTISDMESQPSTPGGALYYNEQDLDSPTKETEILNSHSLTAEEQENISRRTRSKLCLTTTPIETIETTFFPDIPLDMYDFDQEYENDNEWKEFLSEFMMPSTSSTEDDDEKSDPEYVAAETDLMDKDELKSFKVSKRELNQLIAELLEDTANNFSFDQEPSTSTKRNEPQTNKNKRQKLSTSMNSKPQSPRISSRMYNSEELLSTPPARCNSQVSEMPSFNAMSIVQEPNPERRQESTVETIPIDQQLQTPQKETVPFQVTASSPLSLFFSPTQVQMPQQTPMPAEESRLPQITGVYGSAPPALSNEASPTILVRNGQNQLELTSSFNLINQAFCSNGIIQLPQFQQIVVQVPTIDLLQNRLNLSSITAHPQTETNEIISSIEIDAPDIVNINKNQATNKKDKLKEFEVLENEEPEGNQFDENLRGFTLEQKNIYEQQMRMHAQLLTQHYVQVYANPKWWEKAESIKENIKELKEVVKPEVSPLTTEHINHCLATCNEWEQELEENNERNKRYAEFLYAEFDHDVVAQEDRYSFKGRFHNRLMEHLLSSKAIVYPKLLPKLPFRMVSFQHVDPPNSELRLLAFGIERFHDELYDKLNILKPPRIREPTISDLVKAIIREYKSFRSESRLYYIIKRYKNLPKMNPIKYYFTHKRAPAFKHELEEAKLIAPKHLRRGLLPKNWDTFMFSYERLQVHPYIPKEDKSEEVVDLTSDVSEASVEKIEDFSSAEKSNPTQSQTIVDNLYKIQITYEEVPKIHICLIAESPEKTVEINSLVSLRTSPRNRSDKSNEEKQNQNLISILKKTSDNLEKPPGKKKSVNFLIPPTPQNRSSPRFAAQDKDSLEIASAYFLTQKFFIVTETFFAKYIKNLKLKNSVNRLLIRAFHWTKTFDIYLRLIQQSVMISKKRPNDNSAGSSTEVGSKPKKNVSSSEEYSKRLHRKLTENQKLIMQNDDSKTTIEKDCSYAYNYLDRVKKTLIDCGDDELYTEFMSMLTTFDPDRESVPELYRKVEQLLMPNYSELVDLFLTFLLPEHASEVGKFFEHFILSNMSNLLQKLKLHFREQPAHIKKIYACLNDLSNESNLTMDRLKAKVLPLLKSNALLTDWFMQLFDKPIESLSEEYETVHIKKSLSDSDSSIDNYEEIHSNELIECPNIDDLNSCGVKYKNGKLMYQGTLLPAKISFLAHEAPTIISMRTDKTSLCLHQIRKHVQFNDPKPAEETPDDVTEPPKKKAKKFKLCDAQTLHAHAVRLNSVHAQNGEKLSDLMHLLNPSGSTNNGTDGDKSPRKQRNAKKSPKKVLSKTSPTSSGNPVTIPQPTNSPSKIVHTSKRSSSAMDEDEVPKRKSKISDQGDSMASKVSAKNHEKKKSKADKATDGPPKKLQIEAKSTANSSEDRGGWTRDEDQMILEQYQVGFKNKDELFNVLLKKLDRTRPEISARYEFLMDIVKMHQTVKVKP